MRSPLMAGLLTALMVLLSGMSAGAATADPASGAVEWQVGSSLYLAGRDYNVSRKVAGSLTATGETISLNGETVVAKDVWIAARHVAIEGEIGGNLTIRSQDALINGRVKGNISFYGAHIAFGPDARIDGDVDYFAGLPAEIDAGAEIKGALKSSVLRDAPFGSDLLQPRDYNSHFTGRDRWSTPGYHLTWWGAIWFGLAAGVVVAFWPGSLARLSDAVNRQGFSALMVGFLFLVLTPVLVLITAFSIIGLPLAIILVMLWPLGVLAGIIAVILTLAGNIESRFTFVDPGLARRLAGVILATFLLRLGVALPGIGTLIWLAAVSYGIGALVLATRNVQFNPE
ncbi:MAG: polymer-forming cytoskeletal protein [Parvibaculum sp.]|nr:polymer-forming cytoskeletal protein [Parvibaculum sp.]